MTFSDGDDLHPRANIDKMASGHPLNDADRQPWLEAVGGRLASLDGPVIIGCSALKRRYRDVIRAKASEPVFFLHLDADAPVLEARVAAREGHFMRARLLQSQFVALEALQAVELGARINIACSLTDMIARAETYVRETMTRASALR